MTMSGLSSFAEAIASWPLLKSANLPFRLVFNQGARPGAHHFVIVGNEDSERFS